MTGRWRPGHTGGPGRPRGVDLRRLAAEKSKADGIDIENAMWGVLKAMLKASINGDVAAAKLVFEKLALNDPAEVNLHHDGAIEAVGPTPPASRVELVKYVRELVNSANELEEIDRDQS